MFEFILNEVSNILSAIEINIGSHGLIAVNSASDSSLQFARGGVSIDMREMYLEKGSIASCSC